jgi:hypothetical protein
MGFIFQTAEERNPVPSHEQLQAQKLQQTNDRVAELEKQVAKMDEFLELIGKAHIYDMWLTDGKMPETKTENYVDFEDLTYDDVASLEDEK